MGTALLNVHRAHTNCSRCNVNQISKATQTTVSAIPNTISAIGHRSMIFISLFFEA